MDYDVKFLKSNSHPKIGNKQFIKQALIQPGYTSLTASLWVECLLKASQVSNTLISSYPRKKSNTVGIRDHFKMLYNIENHRIVRLSSSSCEELTFLELYLCRKSLIILPPFFLIALESAIFQIRCIHFICFFTL